MSGHYIKHRTKQQTSNPFKQMEMEVSSKWKLAAKQAFSGFIHPHPVHNKSLLHQGMKKPLAKWLVNTQS